MLVKGRGGFFFTLRWGTGQVPSFGGGVGGNLARLENKSGSRLDNNIEFAEIWDYSFRKYRSERSSMLSFSLLRNNRVSRRARVLKELE